MPVDLGAALQINPIGATDKLAQLRPVSFHLKNDPHGMVQYGLIAEEVDKVYPELVLHDAEGKIQGVRYDELAPMLLSEVQRLRQTLVTQDRRMVSQADDIRALRAQNEEMRKQVADLADLIRELRLALDGMRADRQLVARK